MTYAAKPEWVRVRLPTGKTYEKLRQLFGGLSLHTVCEESLCPNIDECWNGGTATLMLLGDTCTRGCRFCHVKSGNPKSVLDPMEPEKVAHVVTTMGLKYVVLTSVDRDDLADGGAEHFAATIKAIRRSCPFTKIEVLIPDFQGNLDSLTKILDASPNVIAHNIETTERLTCYVRDRRAGYRQSLNVLKNIKTLSPETYTKSSMMLGLGETEAEVMTTLGDLRSVGVDIVTLGQYLRPTKWHLEVVDYVTPMKFGYYKQRAEEIGFLYVASGPLVRSSYRAGELFMTSLLSKSDL